MGKIISLDLLVILCLMQPFLWQGHITGSETTWCSFLQSCFPAGGSQDMLVHGIAAPQVQDEALPLVGLYEDPVSLFLQPAEVPLEGCMPWSWSSPSRADCIYPGGWIEEKMFLFPTTLLYLSQVDTKVTLMWQQLCCQVQLFPWAAQLYISIPSYTKWEQ